MDKETRSRIQRATQAARALLEQEFAEQLEGVFDIRLDGTIASEAGTHLDAPQKILRGKLVAAIGHLRAGGHGEAGDAVAAYMREAAFTTLNRFVALKMLEARGLVQECISQGEQSSGFKEFGGLAPGLVQLPDHGYRLYIESLFDEIGREVRVLFDRRDPASLLWPSRAALFGSQQQRGLLEILDDPELAGVWDQDETIGWVYQYFNGDAERKQMRAESQAPRNSRELAVRNQFFTPRYVVQFLTDNTLGRIWYEMRHGETGLRDLDYLVRRSNEVFLAEGEAPPPDSDGGDEGLSQEELLRRPVHIPFRPKKDPRDLRVLDPACGSGHFLLYAFDLLLVIYEEAWTDPDTRDSEVTGRTLCEDYQDLDALRAALPGLILRHNLYGIDIDPRAAQIAALALWMRAQREFKDFGIARPERPGIQKTNIVVAEPMPGELELRREFLATIDPDVGRLVESVFEHMELAGEAGSLLRIEAAIRDEVREIYDEHGPLFRELDEERWEHAGRQVLRALHVYAEHASNGRAYRRRLFAQDAAHGFGLIEILFLRFDVVLMNPPFGATSQVLYDYVRENYKHSYADISAAFMSLLGILGDRSAMLGSISTRSYLNSADLEEFRYRVVIPQASLLLDLGPSVMDGAWVEACAQVFSRCPCSELLVVDRRNTGMSERESPISINRRNSLKTDTTYLLPRSYFYSVPKKRIAYTASGGIGRLVTKTPKLSDVVRSTTGLRTFEDERFYRLWWEVSADAIGNERTWRFIAKNTEFSAFYYPYHAVVKWEDDGRELAAKNINVNGQIAQSRQGSKYYGKAGISFSRRSEPTFAARVHPAGCCFSSNSGVVFANEDHIETYYALGLGNATPIRAGFRLLANKYSFTSGHVHALWWQSPGLLASRVQDATRAAVVAKHLIESLDECDPNFTAVLHRNWRRGLAATVANLKAFVEQQSNVIRESQIEIDNTVCTVYGLDNDEDTWTDHRARSADTSRISLSTEEPNITLRLLSIAVGCVMGRYAPSSQPEALETAIKDPLACIVPASPMESSDAVPSGGAVFPDDLGSSGDLASALDESLISTYGQDQEEVYTDLCDLFGDEQWDTREWLRSRFFDAHLRFCTKSRRIAPIYWQLATASASYSVWLYYHRFSRDTFYKVLNDYVIPKLQHEERRLAGLAQDAGGNPTAIQRKEFAEQEAFVEELRAFREEVARIAPLWNPDLNDGVIINFAPLWRLVPQHRAWQKECKACWDKLVAGDYDWAHLAMHLWPERAVPKCAKDRSLAIAHGLDRVFWEEDDDGKLQPLKVPQLEIDELIAERTSAAVKDALNSLLEAPAPAIRRGGGRRSSARKKTGRKSARSRSAAPDAAVLDAVKKAVGESGDGISKADALAVTGLTDSQWNAAVKVLLADGSVTKTGAGRGTRYHSATGN